MPLGAREQRQVIDFDNGWLFARYGLQADGTRQPEPENPQAPDFCDTAWRKLDLPHDWAIEGPFRQELEGSTGKLPWKGIGLYRKHFTVGEENKGKSIYLDFDGAMANAEVWLNGRKVGEHPYGYTSFRVDLTPYIEYGEDNVLYVKLNTEKWGSRWYPGAGIYRHVRMVITNPVHVAQWGIFVTTPEITPQKATVNVQLSVDNRADENKDISFQVAIFQMDKNGGKGKKETESRMLPLHINKDGKTTGSVQLSVENPQLWSPEATNRYIAEVKLYEHGRQIDEYDTSFGFRTIEFTHDNGFLLNGKRVQIKGVCMHHDLGALGTAINTSALRRQLTVLKSFGCNAIRTSHNPPAPELLDLADEMGFLVMDEAFDCWTIGKTEYDYASLFNEWHEKDLEALVCRDRNHPSIILWSTGNEVPEQYHPESGWARRLTETVHRFDPTRPVTFGASGPKNSAMNGTELQVDVHGMNYPSGCYGGPDFYGEFLAKEGHENIAGYASETSSTFSSRGVYFPQGFQCSSYDLNEPGWGSLPDQEFAALDKYPGICGEFVWTGFDYIGEPTPHNSDNSILLNYSGVNDDELNRRKAELAEIEKNRPTSRSSYFGIVDMAGFPKDRYYLYQSHWKPEKPMAHILPHWNFPDRIGQTTPVFVYTSGNQAELFLNGQSLGIKTKQPYEYRLRWDDVVYEPGTLRVVAYKDGEKWAEDSVKTTGEPYKLLMEADKAAICNDGDDLAFVAVSVTDEDGLCVPIACNEISCEIIDGDGEIVATDNGDATCHIVFSSTERPAFNGKLLVIVRAKEHGKKPIRLKVKSPGLQDAEIDIELKS